MIKNILKNVLNLLLLIFVLLVIGFVLWKRFFKSRLPRDIPFSLSEEGFYLLGYICFIYFFIFIFLLLKTKKTSSTNIGNISKYLLYPFTYIDTILKTNKYTLEKSVSYINKKISLLESEFYYMKEPFLIKLYVYFNILPRIFLVSLLIMDIIYFKKVEIFYYFVIVGFIPLIHRYLKFSLGAIDEIYIKYLEKRWDDVWLFPDRSLLKKDLSDFNQSIYEIENIQAYREYVDAEYKNFEFNEKILSIKEYMEFIKTNNSYNPIPSKNEEFFATYLCKDYLINLKPENIKIMKEENNFKNFFDRYYQRFHLMEFRVIFTKIESLLIYFERYSEVTELWYIKLTRALIFLAYFCCWFYILFVSYSTVTDFKLTKILLQILIANVEKVPEPFSEGNMFLFFDLE